MKTFRDHLGKLASTLMLIAVATTCISTTSALDSLERRLPVMIGAASAAEQPEAADKTLSPYFFVKSESPEVDQLPLKSTSAVVSIAGVIADVQVTQVYKNTGQKPLEAIYVFPASTRAAVYGMKMTIGERVITARIRKREEARAAYEQAKSEGKSASLLEQQRPNVFQMNVANILPGDEIKTELRYTELLAPTDGVYEFVYPTVVGPRYSNQPAASAVPSEKWVANPYLHQGEAPPYTFDITTQIAAGLPIQQMTCASHQVDIRYADPTRATVKLAATEQSSGNRDFILEYRLAGEQIESGLLLYQGEQENFFLLMMQPPKRVTASEIPPREYIFIVDVSGSMHGFPLEISKRLLRDLIGSLRPTDVFNVLLFSGGSQLMAEQSLPAAPENIRRATDLIDHQQGGGGTELLPALQRALALPRRDGTSRTLVIATDGYVAVEAETFDLIRKQLGHANFFPFGIGSSVNRFLIEGMARVGAGEPFVITKPDEAPAMAEKFRRYVQAPVLTGARLDFSGFETYDVEPAAVPDVFAERPAIIYGKWRGQPRGTITLHGQSGGHPYHKTIDVGGVRPLDGNSALRYLWARARIAQLGDYDHLRHSDERVATITNLALQYNLLSAYTSFVAIDSLVRRDGGELTTVQQPLPLPEGVSDYAVGQTAMTGAPKFLSAAPMGAGRRTGKAAPAESASGRGYMAEGDAPQPAKAEQKSLDETGMIVSVGEITIQGAMLETAVRQVVEKHLQEIRECVLKSSASPPPAAITLTWRIDPKGKIQQVQVTSPQGLNKGLQSCLKRRVQQWRFSAPQGKAEVTVTMVLRFSARAAE